MYLAGGNFSLASVFLTKWRCGREQAGRQRSPARDGGNARCSCTAHAHEYPHTAADTHPHWVLNARHGARRRSTGAEQSARETY